MSIFSALDDDSTCTMGFKAKGDLDDLVHLPLVIDGCWRSCEEISQYTQAHISQGLWLSMLLQPAKDACGKLLEVAKGNKAIK